ncbi:MAG TPA: 16S rRNA (cytidine(1402)-2'-O)-methyltransferase [Saprospiraceae bacterium]|nr:16S rRNA (cytidine(1402)-2'-O)-methyltransferase [Saprospiraceae bacterium]
MLYVIPTPIGNLEDITLRAIRLLGEVDFILAEDTRTSQKLLQHLELDTPLKAFHAHNEHKVLEQYLQALQNGQQIALISDAGTPGISDPGFLLVRACAQKDIPVVVLPGPTALIPALVASGLPADKFHFEGFLPHKKGRQTRLKYLAELPVTFLLYESPYRLIKCLGQLAEHCGPERPAAVCRELSKLHEEIRRGTLQELKEYYEGPGVDKGEIVIAVAGKS